MSSRIRKIAAARALRARARLRREPAGPPSPVLRQPGEPSEELWRRRLEQSTDDSWAGVPMMKLPEDLRVYQHLIWEMRADTVIEVGAKWGGSLLWFRDQLRGFAAYGRIEQRRPRVIGLDITTGQAATLLGRADPAWGEEIKLLEGDVTSAGIGELIEAELAPGARPLIVEDAAHTREVTLAALEALSPLVPDGGYFVVEDGHVDIPELHPEGPPEMSQLGVTAGGVSTAISEFLAAPAGAEFSAHPELELYALTSNPGGYLQRRGRKQA